MFGFFLDPLQRLAQHGAIREVLGVQITRGGLAQPGDPAKRHAGEIDKLRGIPWGRLTQFKGLRTAIYRPARDRDARGRRRPGAVSIMPRLRNFG